MKICICLDLLSPLEQEIKLNVVETLTDRITVMWNVSNSEPNSMVNVTWTLENKQENSTSIEMTAGSSNFTIGNLEPCADYTICVSVNLNPVNSCVVAHTAEISKFAIKLEFHHVA